MNRGAVGILVAAVGLLPAPALAAFPGQNGRIGFVSARDGGYEIYAMDADGSNQIRLTTSLSNYDPAWSPAGDKIAFASGRDGNWEIYVMNADGTGQSRITTTATAERSPAWSPAGDRLVFVRCAEGNTEPPFNDCELATMRADGSGVATISQDATADYFSPAWSPGGAQIAYAKCPGFTIPPEPCRVYVSDVDGTNEQLLTSPSSVDPEWLPDGARIAYTSVDDEGGSNLHAVRPDGTSATLVTLGPGHEFGPAWSPDGAKLAFESNPVESPDYTTSEIWVAKADGSGITRLTTNTSEDSSADWQCDPAACAKPPPPDAQRPPDPAKPVPVRPEATPPALVMTSRSLQRPLRQGGLVVDVGCLDQTCDVVATASIRVPKNSARVYRLRAKARLTKGQTVRLKLRMSRKVKAAVKRALRKRPSLRARLTVTAKGPDGPATVRKRTIRLRG